MDITKLSIKRPIALLMVVCIVVLLGWVSFTSLPIDLVPSMNIPYALVMTTYPGAGPYVIENMVTKPMESAVATVQNVKTVQSQSAEGTSFVVAEFADGTDMDFASLDLREKIDLIKPMLPDGVGDPMVLKMDLNSMPIASLTVSGEMGRTI
jgi:HAE1 family hydrophobic/amphiphilic exporter-1